jgi:glycosyltransferase involved in cell wall biosynthesis
MSSSSPVSVIIPVRNAAKHFATLLESVAAQTIGTTIEVIVVDNLSTDGSPAIAETFAGRIDLKIVKADARRNASYARNVGVRAAKSEKLLFLDADDEIAPGYVAAMSAALDSHDYVTSRVDSETLNPGWNRRAIGDWNESGLWIAFGFMPATGTNVGVRRSLFKAVNGFPEEFSASQDIAFSWNLQLAGASPYFVRDAVYRYRHRDSLIGLFRQCKNWGFSNALLFRRYRKFGMPRRKLSVAIREWVDSSVGLVRARTKAESGAFVTRFGYCVGRLKGSIRFGVFYL